MEFVYFVNFLIFLGRIKFTESMAENESIYGDSFNETSSSVPTSFFDDMFTKVVFICAYSTVFALCVFGKCSFISFYMPTKLMVYFISYNCNCD